MSAWTRAFVDEAPSHGIDVHLKRVGVREESQILRLSSRVTRVVGNVLGPSADIVLSGARGCDVVHVCTSGRMGIWSGLFIAEAAVRRGLPTVLHVHSGLGDANYGVNRLFARLGAHPLVRLVTPSHEDAAERGDFVLIDNMVARGFDAPDREADAGRAEETLRLLYLGWVIRTKGLFELVEAVAEVAGVSVDLVGPNVRPAEALELQARIDALGMRERVRILPTVPHEELPGLMRRYDALVHPSHSESFGMVSVEAMLAGLPVLGTRVGVLWDMADELFVPLPMKDAHELADVLARTRDGGGARLRSIAERAREHARLRYRPEAVLARWRDLYLELLRHP